MILTQQRSKNPIESIARQRSGAGLVLQWTIFETYLQMPKNGDNRLLLRAMNILQVFFSQTLFSGSN